MHLLHRNHGFHSAHRRIPSRRGGMSTWLILGLTLLLALLALAIDGANLWQARVELRNSSDAMVLATAQALLDDEILTNKPNVMRQAVERSYAEAVAYGQANPVLGRPQELIFTPDDPEQSDLVFGYKEDPAVRGFTPAYDLDDQHINTVRVIARRTRERGNPAGMYFGRFLSLPFADVVASATAYLDRDVIGFRPIGSVPVPLAPLALLTDPTMTDSEAWETQTIKPTLSPTPSGTDDFVFDRANKRFLEVGVNAEHGDGLYEMNVYIPLEGQPNFEQDRDDANGCFLFDGELGPNGETNWQPIARQFRTGVTRDDLVKLDGQIVLGSDNRLILPGLPSAPSLQSQDLNVLLDGLEALEASGDPRVWPIYSLVEQDPNSPMRWRTTVQGFVAARLARVEVIQVGEAGAQQRQMLRLTLQPCMMAVHSAVTDFSRRHANPEFDIYNRYISKVRLVNE
jgi:hypothetical protein